MAVLDAQLEFSTAELLTASTYSENVLDKVAAGAVGKHMYLVVRCGTILDSSGDSAVLNMTLRTSATISTDLNGTVIDLVRSRQWAESEITANQVLWVVAVPSNMLRYLQLYYAVTTEDFTSGTIHAPLTPDP